MSNRNETPPDASSRRFYRSHQDERLGPPGPERFQRNPEQLVQGSQSMAGSLRVQSQQLLTETQVFDDEVLPRTESADHPPEEMPERHDHGKNLIGTVRIELLAKSCILRVYDVLARHKGSNVTAGEPILIGRPEATFTMATSNADVMDFCQDIMTTVARAPQQFRPENPVEKVVRYKNEILNLYCPRLGIQRLGF